jgi:hypothetical protein
VSPEEKGKNFYMIKKDTSTVTNKTITPSKTEKDSRFFHKGVEYFVNGENKKAISIFNKSLMPFPQRQIYTECGERPISEWRTNG